MEVSKNNKILVKNIMNIFTSPYQKKSKTYN